MSKNIGTLMKMVDNAIEDKEYGQLIYDLTYSLGHMIGHSNHPSMAFFSSQKIMMSIIEEIAAQQEKDSTSPTEH